MFRISLNENLDKISDSIAFIKRVDEVLFDAKYFFDDSKIFDYSLKSIKRAYDSGAS